MDPVHFTQLLKSESRRIGFDFCGACPAMEPTGLSTLRDWLDAGFDGEMHYISGRLDAYSNPSHVLDGVKSVLMLGMNYRSVEPVTGQPGTGRLARYAWGDDYHDIVHRKLKQLCKTATGLHPDVGVRGVVDTAPLLEREFAQLAGMGWRAKNTMLINREHGSWFLLAALLVDVPLEYDTPMETNHCGTCTACLTACPTGAFPEPHVLDATKCISYLTIEHRSPVSSELRPQMGEWLLGCDICQDVCPWNNKSSETEKTEFVPRDGQNPVHLAELFDLSDDDFRARFRKTPLWRPKRRGILRNAAIVLGNHPCKKTLPALTKGLDDSEPLVRGACAWALARQAGDVSGLLQARLATEENATVIEELNEAIRFLSQRT